MALIRKKQEPVNGEIVQPPATSFTPLSRRFDREFAMKALFVLEFGDCTVDGVLKDPLVNSEEMNGEGERSIFADEIVRKVMENREKLDEIIKSKIIKWEFHRVALIDKIVMRIAVCEILYFKDVPPKVSINEAIDIAKKYSTNRSGAFVNGVLDAVFNDIVKGKLVSV